MELPNIQLALIVGALIAALASWRLARYRMITTLRWPASLDNKKLAKLCRYYFATHGISSTCEASLIFDLSIPRGQFQNNLGQFLIGTRGRDYLGGGSQLRDLRDSCLNAHLGARPLIITPSPITSDLLSASLVTDVPMLSVGDLPEFAKALKDAKSLDWTGYNGSSAKVAAALKPLRTSRDLIRQGFPSINT